MASAPLEVRMLGTFSISFRGAEINDGDNRSRKVWLLLAYMIYCRNRPVAPEELVNLLWGDEERSTNPLNALKTMFHRVRTFLNQLDGSTGHEFIIRRDGSYAWNTNVALTLDIDEFDRLCQAGTRAETDAEKLDYWTQALALYRGDFLAKLSSEPWVVPIASYFHNLYVKTALQVIPMLEQNQRWQEAADLCRAATMHEPYMEELYRHLMTALLQLGDQRSAVTVFEDMSQLLLANFGIMPSDELRSLYRDTLRSLNERTMSPNLILDQLRESSDEGGALVCDYDFFKVIYHSIARMIERSGDAAHLALISILSDSDKPLSRRSLDCVIENLQDLIRINLRRGDVAARCSVSQYILLLPQANYENSCNICERISKAFVRQYPHSPARLQTSVQPLEPNSRR